jgi:uncharacterized delta-60 repeat protein
LLFVLCFARLNADGSLDSTFDGPSGTGNGRFLLTVGSGSHFLLALALQSDGKIVFAGSCPLDNYVSICVARLNLDGSLDASFNAPSILINGPAPQTQVGFETVTQLGLQPDGKIVIAGRNCGNSNLVCMARLHTDGGFDTSFDGPPTGPSGSGDGRFLLSIGSNDNDIRALTLQPDGKIVLVGICGNGSNNDFCAARLNGGPFGGQNCKFDVDGDGLVTATTDMLIGTRVALGLRGTSVINGISFPANAKRNTWLLIRDYLVSQCGMSVF